MVLGRSPWHKGGPDFLGTRWRQPRPRGLRTVDWTHSRLSHSRYIRTHTAPGPWGTWVWNQRRRPRRRAAGAQARTGRYPTQNSKLESAI